MTANQRRSGFRLPWVSEEDDPNGPTTAAPGESSEASAADAAQPPTQPAWTNGAQAPDTTSAVTPAASEAPAPGEAPAPAPEASNEFLAELIGAMRKVADEARDTGVTKLKADAEEAVRALEVEAERRRQELRERAEADVAGVGEWARAEAERIRLEAEQRVAARRAQLEQQLAAEAARTEAEAKTLRSRVEDYERELEAFHAQLNEINDPAAFAAAAKRMPSPPDLTPRTPAPAAEAQPAPVRAATEPATPEPAATNGQAAPTEPATPADVAPATEAVHPAEEEVLSARLADLDARLGEQPAAAPQTAAPTAVASEAASTAGQQETAAPAEPASEGSATTEIVVKGLGSFGAITGFRQALSTQDGISGVALSLGQTGEFVFRATHAPGFDVGAAIAALEGDNASIEPRAEGGLRVTLDRAR